MENKTIHSLQIPFDTGVQPHVKRSSNGEAILCEHLSIESAGQFFCALLNIKLQNGLGPIQAPSCALPFRSRTCEILENKPQSE